MTLAGHPVQLTAIEYGLLFELSANAGNVMTYNRLLQRVWGLRGSCDSRRVRTAAKQLRRKLGDDVNNPTYIINEPRVGYRMAKGEEQEREEAGQWEHNSGEAVSLQSQPPCQYHVCGHPLLSDSWRCIDYLSVFVIFLPYSINLARRRRDRL